MTPLAIATVELCLTCLSLGFILGMWLTWWRGQVDIQRLQMFAYHDGLCTGLRISGGTVIALDVSRKPRAQA